MVSTLQGALDFFREFGLFDVVLPFLLVFAVIFAILEKTRILGADGPEGTAVPKHSLNSTVAFVVAMLVVATNKVVTAINTALPNVVLLVVFVIAFLMLAGMFYQEGKFDFAAQYTTSTKILVALLFVAILLIFADAVPYKNTGESWLEVFWDYIINNYSSTVVGSIVMLIILVLSVLYVTGAFSGRQQGQPGTGG